MSNSDKEMKDSERTVIAKPVASRPSSFNFRSFSKLLAGSIDPSLPSTSTDATAITAIRPKTVRFKPTANRSPPSAAATTSQVLCSNFLQIDDLISSACLFGTPDRNLKESERKFERQCVETRMQQQAHCYLQTPGEACVEVNCLALGEHG